MNITAQQAKEAQLAAQNAREMARQYQEKRDVLVRLLHQRDKLSYTMIATEVGLTPETVAKIINPQVRNKTRSPVR